jgi:hypothetical protein
MKSANSLELAEMIGEVSGGSEKRREEYSTCLARRGAPGRKSGCGAGAMVESGEQWRLWRVSLVAVSACWIGRAVR